MSRKWLFIGVGVSLVALYMLMSLTDPTRTHPIILLAFFVVLYIVLLLCTMLIMSALIGVLHKLGIIRKRADTARNITVSDSYIYASVLALAPTILIAMQSIGNIRPVAVMLVGIFEIIAIFYVQRRR